MKYPKEARPVRKTLRFGIALMLIVAVIAGTAGIGAMVIINSRLNSIVNRLSPLSAENATVLQALTDAETGVRGYELTNNAVFLQPYQLGMSEYPSAMRRALALAPDEKTRKLLDEENIAAQKWITTFAEPIVAQPVSRSADQIVNSSTEGKDLFDQIRVKNTAVGSYVYLLIQRNGSNARQAERYCLTALALLVLLATSVAIIVSRRATKDIVAPLEGLSTTIGELAQGNRKARASEIGPLEVQTVSVAVNGLAAESERRSIEQERRAHFNDLNARVARHVNEHLELERLLVESVAIIGAALRCSRVTIRLAKDGRIQSTAAVWRSENAKPADGSVVVPRSWKRFLNDVAAKKEIFLADDIEKVAPLAEHPDLVAYLRQAELRSLAVCPLSTEEEVLGVLLLVHDQTAPWDPVDMALVRDIATDLSRAIFHSHLYERQKELIEELQDLDRAKVDFLSTVSHELRTPLTSISGYVELLSEGAAGDISQKQKDMLAVVDRNAVRLRGLIEDLLTLSRMESQAFKLSIESVSLSDVLEAATASIVPVATNKHLSVVVDEVDRSAVVKADSDQLERAFLNLLSNAVKFTPEGGVVRVSTRLTETEAAVSIADTGIGIPDQDQSKLFNRFYRASNAIEKSLPGTGLGLVIVQGIVEQHGGRLEMCSAVDEGTTFVVKLPLDVHKSTVPQQG